MPISAQCCRLAERSGCAVSVHVPGDDADEDAAAARSCSGVVLSWAPAVVLCHGGAFAAALRRASPTGPTAAPCDGPTGPTAALHDANTAALRAGVRVQVVAAPRGRRCHVAARLLALVPCGAAEAAALEVETPTLFALLRVPALDGAADGAAWTPWGSASALRKGQALVACGSAFGALRPALFLNALSAGVLSNAAGALLLTDARCPPGTQGAGVFADGARPRLVAAVAAPLGAHCGLTLLCSLDAILQAASACLERAGVPRPPLPMDPQEEEAVVPAPARVALVQCGPAWGSGVLLAPRLLLTCRHVLRAGAAVTVRVGDARALRGRVVFMAREESPFDVAVVELERPVRGFVPPRLATSFQPGEDVHVESYGPLGGTWGPSLTAGVLSAVLAVAGRPVMLQTTCAVHSGSSGAPVLSARTGQLLGMVASNTKDTRAGTTYPHLNFSVPVTVLRPALERYARTGAAAVWAPLDAAAAGVRELWRLQPPPPSALLSKL